MPESPDLQRTSRLQSILTVIVGTVLFFLIVGIAGRGLGHLLRDYASRSIRRRATVAITGSMIGEIIVVSLLILFLRGRKQSLRDLGLWRFAPLRGWVVAILFTAIFLWLTFTSVLRGHAPLTEVSLFHVYNSLIAGIVAGFVEEIFFRGFVMTELKWSGFGGTVQVIVAGVLFGIAHSGWGLFSKHIDWPALIGAVIGTTILGAAFAVAYLASRRSLMPVIACHMVMDLLIEPWLIVAGLSAALSSHPH